MIEINKKLSYHQAFAREMLKDETSLTVTLTIDECAAILEAHDYSICNIKPESLRCLDIVMSKLKAEIWP